MPDLVVIQLVPGGMTDNLARSLEQPDRHPWAFNKLLSSMNGMRPGVHVLFVLMTASDGRGVGKAGAYPEDAVARRAVLGTLTTPVVETTTPFFDGFPHEFWFELAADLSFDPAVDLGGLSQWLEEAVPGLGMDAPKLRQTLSNGRSAKIGMYFDGQPRLTDYFKTTPAPRAVLPSPVAADDDVQSQPTNRAAGSVGSAVSAFARAVSDAGLVFGGVNEAMPEAFLAGLMAKPFVLLTGLSGSGKTQLARAFGQWLGDDGEGPCRLVVPVRADWTTPDPLLGYEDALLPSNSGGERAWSVPPALDFMLRARKQPDLSYVLVLDEMNLAHVERYFADVLSGMESGEPVLPNLQRDSTGHWYPVTGEDAFVALPRNLFIVGTVNIDETTYQFSPKVLDRSFSFEFRVSTAELTAELTDLQPVVAAEPAHLAAIRELGNDRDWHLTHPPEASADIEGVLIAVHEQLSRIGLEFGHRSFREAMRFAAVLAACGVDETEELIDWTLMTKVLPRVHGSRRQLEPFLRWLSSDAAEAEHAKPRYPLVHRKVARMLDSLLTNQYAGFAE